MSRALLPLSCTIFFLSGSSALIFETLWFRQASLVFGSSVSAIAVVLSAFMAGQAIGNAAAARYAARLRRAFGAYAALEAMIAGAGFALVAGLPALTSAFSSWLQPFLASSGTLQLLRFALGFALLVTPAVAMGATLPTLVQAVRERQPEFGRVLARLYGWNTLGAVCGALAAELWLIPAFGLRASGGAAASLNILAALLALAIARALVASRPEPATEPAQAPRPIDAHAARLLLAAFAAGAALLGLEVVWFRTLAQFLPSTSEIFAWMLAVVLLGIATGSLCVPRLLRWMPDAHRRVAGFACAAGVCVLLGHLALVTFVDRGLEALRATGAGAGRPQISQPFMLVMATVLMLPTAALSGAIFPLLGKRLAEVVGGTTRATGLLALANTLGAMVGPLVVGFWLLPTFGMARATLWLAASYAAIALCTWREPATRATAWRAARAPAVLALSALLFPGGALEALLRKQIEIAYGGRERVVEFREGIVENIAYLERDWLGIPLYHRLVTDGYSMSGTTLAAQRYMRLYVNLPAALHPRLERALLISYGVGVTASALVELDELTQIDVVDISPEILELSAIIYGDDRPLDDPRVRSIIEDGRYYLQTTPERYDLITGEPPPPAYAGVVNLYTREYFEAMHARLREGGLATYWLPISQLRGIDAKAITRAFCEAFADCSLWDSTPGNWMLLGRRGTRPAFSPTRLHAQWQRPRSARSLEDIGLEGPADLGALFLADAPLLAAWTEGVEPLVDNFPGRAPPVWAGAPNDPAYQFARDPSERIRRFEASAAMRASWPLAERASVLGAMQLQPLVHAALLRTRPPLQALADAHRLLSQTQRRSLPLWLLGSNPQLQRAAQRTPRQNDPRAAYHRAVGALVVGRESDARRALLRAAAPDSPLRATALGLQLYLACRSGDDDAVSQLDRFADTPLARIDSYWELVSRLCAASDGPRAQ